MATDTLTSQTSAMRLARAGLAEADAWLDGVGDWSLLLELIDEATPDDPFGADVLFYALMFAAIMMRRSGDGRESLQALALKMEM